MALAGDFNAYGQEDPLRTSSTTPATRTPAERSGSYESSYSLSGLYGSLDHVLAERRRQVARATGADIWAINAPESLALEYSRYNYHGTLFYAPDAFRSSDHDPVKVGLDAGGRGIHHRRSSSRRPRSSTERREPSRRRRPSRRMSRPPAACSSWSAAPSSRPPQLAGGIATANLPLPGTYPVGTYDVVARYSRSAEVAASESAPVSPHGPCLRVRDRPARGAARARQPSPLPSTLFAWVTLEIGNRTGGRRRVPGGRVAHRDRPSRARIGERHAPEHADARNAPVHRDLRASRSRRSPRLRHRRGLRPRPPLEVRGRA